MPQGQIGDRPMATFGKHGPRSGLLHQILRRLGETILVPVDFSAHEPFKFRHIRRRQRRQRHQPFESRDGRIVGQRRTAGRDHHRVEDDRHVQRFQPVAQLFGEREIGIEDRIEDCIGKVVRSAGTDARFAAAQTLAHRIKAIARRLLEGQYPLFRKQQGELLARGGVLAIHHVHDDKDKVIEFLGLGALVEVHHVFQRQRVDAEDFAEAGDQRRVTGAGHIHPDALARREGRANI